MEVGRVMVVGENAQFRVAEPVDGWHRLNLAEDYCAIIAHCQA
jgi:hypothetical protein